MATLLLNRSDCASLLSLSACIDVVEQAFRLRAEGKDFTQGLLHIDMDDGEFHIKAGGVRLNRSYFGLKSNGGFFQNRTKYGLPNIQGLILLCDGESGSPLAIFESSEITILRTGAATAVAARYLARPNSKTVAICGCGTQGRSQLRALNEVLPLKKAFAIDQDQDAVQRFVRDMSDQLGISVVPGKLEEAVRNSDICVTCTPSHRPFLKYEYLSKGIFVAAVGADSPEKQELDPKILSENKVVCDILEQGLSVGEIHHAVAKSLLTAENVYGEIGEIILGEKPGRTSNDEIIVFDATGTALQDVAAAAAIYERALVANKGTWFEFHQ